MLMYGMSLLQKIIHSASCAVSLLLCLLLLFLTAKNRSRVLLYFLCFYFLSVFQLCGVFITPLLQRYRTTLPVQTFWFFSQAVGRARFLFLLFFIHSVYRLRGAVVLLIFWTIAILFAVISPFFVYTIFPELIELAVILYAFCFWLVLYLKRKRLPLPGRILALLRPALYCTGLFLSGLVLELLEQIPQTGAYISILMIDFYPVYLVCIGAVVAFWAVRDLYAPQAFRQSGQAADLADFPVSAREREVIELVLDGSTNTSIAEKLFISESTVKKHINSIFRKLNIKSRWEILRLLKPGSGV